MSLSTSTARAAPARDRLDPKRPGPAEEVEDARALDVAEDREERLARAVGRSGARPSTGEAASSSRRPPSSPADDPHSRRRSPPTRSSPKRPRAASSSGPSSGDVERAVALEQRDHLARAPRASSSTSSGQLGDAEARQAVCSVPRISPSPRRARSTSASLKPSRSRRDRLHPAPRELRRRVGEEDAVRLVLAAADPPAQLVELGEPEALGALDQHHGRVRRRRSRPRSRVVATSTSVLPGGERAPSPPAFSARRTSGRAGARPSKSANSPVREPLGLLGSPPSPRSFSRALDQRADDVRLPALAQPVADELVGAGAPLLPHHPGLHGLPAGRQLAERRRVEVAVGGQRERPRDRRRGHVEHVRGACRRSGPLASSAARWRTPKRCCSSTTQTASRANATSGSISAWVPTTSASSPVASRASASRRRAAGVAPVSSVNGIACAAEQPVERGRVLLGERLGRRHQRRLVAGLDARAASRRAATTVLPRAHLPHQQPLHRPLGAEVGVDLVERRALVPRSSSNGSEASQPRDELAGGSRATPGRPSRARRRRAASATWCRKSSSKARRSRAAARLVGRSGKWAARSASAARGSPRRARSSAGSGSIASAASGSACQAHSRSRLRAQPVGGRSGPGRSRSCGSRSADPAPRRDDLVRLATRKPERSSLPWSSSRVPGLQPLGELGLVEPDRLQRARCRRRPSPRRSRRLRRRVGRTRARAHLHHRPSPPRRSAARRACAARRGRGSRAGRAEQVAERLDADLGAAAAASFGPAPSQRRDAARSSGSGRGSERRPHAAQLVAVLRGRRCRSRGRMRVASPTPRRVEAPGRLIVRSQARVTVPGWDGSTTGLSELGLELPAALRRRRRGSSSSSTSSASSGGLAYVSGHLPVDGAEVLVTREGRRRRLGRGGARGRPAHRALDLRLAAAGARRPRPGHGLGQGARARQLPPRASTRLPP